MSWLRFSTSTIERDLDEEFEFHIAERAERLRAGGMSAEAALARARETFGDAARYRAEAAMVVSSRVLRRRAWATSVVCSLLAGSAAFTGAWVIGNMQRRHDLESVQATLDHLRDELAPFRGVGDTPLAQQVRFVTLRGRVANPKVWTLPRETDVTLRELIAKSGGLNPDAAGEIVLSEMSADGRSHETVLARAQWQSPHAPEIRLDGFLTIEVR